MATVDDVRELASGLPRSYEVLVRDRVKFRVGRIVYVAFAADETVMEFAFPKEEREALVAAEPEKFLMPRPSDLRYNWVGVRLGPVSPARGRGAGPAARGVAGQGWLMPVLGAIARPMLASISAIQGFDTLLHPERVASLAEPVVRPVA